MKKILKKLNKGFTLVEIVVTIAIMLAVVSIAVPSAINLSNRSKQRSYELQVKEIETSAKSYVLDNKNKWNVASIGDDEYCFSLEDLEDAEYIEDLEELINPLTSSKFTGSVNIKVVDEKIKYEYSEENCTNSLVSSGLTELNDYDDYLNLNIGDSNGNNIEGNITNTISKINVSKNWNYGVTDIEPGIYCENDYCSFVGATEENYVKFGGNKKMTYPSDIDYNNQAGQDILWRIVSFDKSNNSVKLISDSSVLRSNFNDTYGSRNTEYSGENFSRYNNVDEYYVSTKGRQYSTTVKDSDGTIPNTFQNRIENNYKNMYRVGILNNVYNGTGTGSIAFQNSNAFQKYTSISKNSNGSKRITIYEMKAYDSYYSLFNNVKIKDNTVVFLTIVEDSSDFKSSNWTRMEDPIIISIRRKGDNFLYSELTINSRNVSSKISNALNDWVEDYIDYKSNGINIIKKTKFCTSAYDGTTLKNGNDYRHIRDFYNDLDFNADTIKNCSYLGAETQEEYAGLLSFYEFAYMSGKDDPDSVDTSSTNILNTMFKYNAQSFLTGDWYKAYIEFEIIGDIYYKSDPLNVVVVEMYAIGQSDNYPSVDDVRPIRPVITIDGTIEFSSGNGTKNDPWIINVD